MIIETSINLKNKSKEELILLLNERLGIIEKLQKENEKLKNDMCNMYNEEVVISIMCDEFNLSKNEALRILGGE